MRLETSRVPVADSVSCTTGTHSVQGQDKGDGESTGNVRRIESARPVLIKTAMLNNKARAQTSDASAGIALEHPFAVWNVGSETDEGMDSRRLGNAILCAAVFRAYVAFAVVQAAFLVSMIFMNLRG